MARQVWTPELVREIQEIAKKKGISEGEAAKTKGYSAGAFSQGKNGLKRKGLLRKKYTKKMARPVSMDIEIDAPTPKASTVTVLVVPINQLKQVLEAYT